MKLKELTSRLSRAELSNLAIGNNGDGTIQEKHIAKIVGYANEGLMKIYSRFILLEKSVIIQQYEYITKYHLLRRFSEANGAIGTVKYIKDSINEPFTEDAIKIIEVYDSNGIPRPLNDTLRAGSLFTPQPTTLQVPTPKEGEALSVSYQARHPHLKEEGQNLLDQNIDLPVFLEGALQSFVAYKVYSHMNSQEQKLIAQEHFQTYDGSCKDIEAQDLVNNTISTTTSKLADRGFV